MKEIRLVPNSDDYIPDRLEFITNRGDTIQVYAERIHSKERDCADVRYLHNFQHKYGWVAIFLTLKKNEIDVVLTGHSVFTTPLYKNGSCMESIYLCQKKVSKYMKGDC